jgi:hypothetical protein
MALAPGTKLGLYEIQSPLGVADHPPSAKAFTVR